MTRLNSHVVACVGLLTSLKLKKLEIFDMGEGESLRKSTFMNHSDIYYLDSVFIGLSLRFQEWAKINISKRFKI